MDPLQTSQLIGLSTHAEEVHGKRVTIVRWGNQQVEKGLVPAFHRTDHKIEATLKMTRQGRMMNKELDSVKLAITNTSLFNNEALEQASIIRGGSAQEMKLISPRVTKGQAESQQRLRETIEESTSSRDQTGERQTVLIDPGAAAEGQVDEARRLHGHEARR